MKNLALLLLLFSLSYVGFSQNIKFSNPSFEDYPKISSAPLNWYDCGLPRESPPDVQPDPTFGVTKEAYDGGTYLGMVVRDNDTWESVSQRISEPLQEGACYQFEIYLARSLTYMSVSRSSHKEANYATPVKLKIWGGFGHCDKAQLLGQTNLITHTDWQAYLIQFRAQKAYQYIIFEAYYDEPTIFPYNGNLLLDYLSEIERVNCGVNSTSPELKQARSATKSAPKSYLDVVAPSSIVTSAPKPPVKRPLNQVATKPISEEELAGILETSAARITFNAFGTLIHSAYTDPQTGSEYMVNLPLHSIVQAVRQYPLSMLIIAITEEDAALATRKRESLNEALEKMGAPKGQIVVRGWLEKDAEKEWQGDKTTGVLLRLVR